jgi:hypothetical protein
MSGVSAAKGLPPNNARKTPFVPDDPAGRFHRHAFFNLDRPFFKKPLYQCPDWPDATYSALSPKTDRIVVKTYRPPSFGAWVTAETAVLPYRRPQPPYIVQFLY